VNSKTDIGRSSHQCSFPWKGAATLLASCLGLFLAGCSGSAGDSPPRVIVTGSVTFQGQPVSKGTIRFVPDETSQLPVSGAVITNGQYRADNKGGVPVGRHRIEITAVRPPAQGNGIEVVEGVPEEHYIPSKYNTESTLEFIVTQEGSNPLQHDFNLQ